VFRQPAKNNLKLKIELQRLIRQGHLMTATPRCLSTWRNKASRMDLDVVPCANVPKQNISSQTISKMPAMHGTAAAMNQRGRISKQATRKER